jgi:predicted methyltransferase
MNQKEIILYPKKTRKVILAKLYITLLKQKQIIIVDKDKKYINFYDKIYNKYNYDSLYE